MSKPSADASFLKDYLRYDELTLTLERWAREHPEFIRLSSLAKTENGRDIWLLEIGKDPDRHRPAICVDGNMHSAELLGTNASLCVAEELVHLHLGQSKTCASWPRTVREAALEALYYIIPCVSPDGAEEVLTAGRISRSAPRRRGQSNAPHWVRSDVDGDGRIRQIRLRHPAGEFVEHPDFSHVLVPRTVYDAGPFFKVFPEGIIENFNGRNVPFADTLSDNDSDFNRNFPYDWSSQHDGAGRFPGWEPETRALIEFGARSPHIFSWLNLHTFGGIFIRPPFSDSTKDVHREDLLIYEYAAALAAEYTGMPTIGAFEDMTPVASRPMTGTLAAWAYGERGCLAWAVELWDLFAATGLQKRQPFFRNYAAQQREEIAALAGWDARENGGRVFSAWRAFEHPQLKDVEIGGIDPLRGFINPPEKEIARISGRLAAFAIALASLAPRLQTHVTTERISEKLTRIDLLAINGGYLPTYVSAISRGRAWNCALQARFRASGCTRVSGPSPADLGHLLGWGRGADEEANAPFFQKSQAIEDVGLTWVVQGSGQVEIEIGAPRVGWQAHKLAVGAG